MMRADRDADRVYDRYAGWYGDEDPRASGYRSVAGFEGERRLVVEALESLDRPDGPMLDLACGAGLITRPLRERGREVVGLDFNQVACENAQRLGMTIVRGDAFRLPFADASFASVVSVEMFQQYVLDDVRRILEEASRVLRPGGHAVLVWRNGRSLPHRLATFLLRPLDRARGIGDLGLKNHAPGDMVRVAAEAGLLLVRSDAILPPLRLRFPTSRRSLTSLAGSSFLAVFARDGAVD